MEEVLTSSSVLPEFKVPHTDIQKRKVAYKDNLFNFKFSLPKISEFMYLKSYVLYYNIIYI